MAVSLESAFILLDRASGPLRKIRLEAEKTDKALRNMGGGSAGAQGWTRQYSAVSQGIGKIENAAKGATRETKNFANETERAAGALRRGLAHLRNWRAEFSKLHPHLFKVGQGLAGVVGGVMGVAKAIPLMGWAIIAVTAVIQPLIGALGSLLSSLGAAVGGGGALGAGLLGSFVVGLGSIVAVGKPAIKSLQDYRKAVTGLNEAIASGNQAGIKKFQAEIDKISKANPGLIEFNRSLNQFQKEWHKATQPARANFFGLLTSGIDEARTMLPKLTAEANKNTGAMRRAFDSVREPLRKALEPLITGLGKVFRSNLPGFMRGLVNIVQGLTNTLKALAPQLGKAGDGFEKFTAKFAKWTGSAKGQNQIREMGNAFRQWMRLLGNIIRLIGVIGGAGTKSGTAVVTDWANKVGKLADRLASPKGQASIKNFFQRSLDQAGKIWDTLKAVMGQLKDLYPGIKALGSAASFLIKNLPPGFLTAVGTLYLGIKAFKGGAGAVNTFREFFNKQRGATPANPMYVADVTGGGGGLAGGKGGKWWKKLPTVGGGIVAFATGVGVLYGSAALFRSILGDQANPMDTETARRNERAYTRSGYEQTLKSGQTRRELAPRTGYGRTSLTARGGPLPAAPAPVGGLQPVPAFAGKATLGLDMRVYQSGLAAARRALANFTGSLPGSFNKPVSRATGKAKNDFQNFGTGGKRSLSDLQSTGSGQMQTLSKNARFSTKTLHDRGGQNLSDFSSKGQDAVKQLRDNGGWYMERFSSKVQGEAGKEITTIGQLAGKVQTGLADIFTKVNAALGSMGVGPISLAKTAIKGTAAAAGGAFAAVAAKVGAGKKALGGRLPGPAIGDHIPLFGRGGGLLGVADGGELVVNRHTEARQNAINRRAGAPPLGSLVAGESTAHADAKRELQGGPVGFQLGGMLTSAVANVANAVGSATNSGWKTVKHSMENDIGKMGAYGTISPYGYSELSTNPNPSGGWDFAALGKLPPHTRMRIRKGPREVVAQKQDVGSGSSFHPAMGLYPGTARQLGISDNGLVDIQRADGAPLTIGGGIGSFGTTAAVPIPVIAAPVITGPGAWGKLGNAAMRKVTDAGNKFIASKAPVGSTGGGVPGAPGPPGGPTGVSTYKGIQIANWVIAALRHAESKGVAVVPTSGYRPGVDPHTATGRSEHQGTQYPHGAVDFGGYETGGAMKRAVTAATADFKWPLLNPIGFHDEGHASGTGHAFGGRLPWYRSGADFVARRPQVIGVGDHPGGERVTVTPQGGGRIGNSPLHVEIHKIEVNRKGDVQKIVDEELRLLAGSIERNL